MGRNRSCCWISGSSSCCWRSTPPSSSSTSLPPRNHLHQWMNSRHVSAERRAHAPLRELLDENEQVAHPIHPSTHPPIHLPPL